MVDVDEEASRHYADLWSELRRIGRPLPTNDVWIAAVALRTGATVVTCDDQLRAIDRLGAIVLEE